MQSLTAAPRDVLTGYSIIREIHRGGQAVVYLARQRHPERQVALKVLREGPFAGVDDLTRFEREVRILAALRHPNIVAIHDSGSAGGFFYYAMDYIDGKPLDQFVRGTSATLAALEVDHAHRKPSSERADGTALDCKSIVRLFVTVCGAVNAAHLRGIIHRDLKPGNVLIDAAGEPHVLDFGLARASGDAASDAPSVTRTGQFVGSPPWASPEQAEGRETLDIRTDVYSIGVMLFQALTGRFPYRVTGGMREVLDSIVNTAAPPPSRFNTALDADVDTIVLKCLAKEPERRYQSAGELAADLRRYLAGEPIDARRASTLYVLRKSLRRHWAAATIAGLFVVSIAISAVVMTMLYRDQKTQRERADANAELALSEQRRAERFAEDARGRFRSARSAVEFLVDEVSTELAPLFGTAQVRKDLLKRAFTHLRDLAAEKSDDPKLQLDLARLHAKLAAVAREIDAVDEIARERGLALEIVNQVLAGQPDDLEALIIRAQIEQSNGDDAIRANDLSTAEALYKSSAAVFQHVSALKPDSAEPIRLLSLGYERNAMLARARSDAAKDAEWTAKMLELKRRAAEMEPQTSLFRFELSIAEERSANVLIRADREADAEAHVRAALALREQLVREAPDNRHYLRALSISFEQMAQLARARSAKDEEYAWVGRMHDTKRQLVAREPQNRLYQHDLAISLDYLARLDRDRGDNASAALRCAAAVETYRRLVDSEPKMLRFRTDLGSSLGDLAETQLRMGETDAAAANFAESLRFAQAVREESPRNRDALQTIAIGNLALARISREQNRAEREHEYLAVAESAARAILEFAPQDTRAKRHLTEIENRRGVSAGAGDSAD